LVDEAASALRLAQESKPDELESLEREIMTLQIELESLKKEMDVFSVERRNKVETDLLIKRQEADALTAVWKAGALFDVPGLSSMYLRLLFQNATDWRRLRRRRRN
jgi:ATP-dependent Clp protease ATP-binding subunit ClpA